MTRVSLSVLGGHKLRADAAASFERARPLIEALHRPLALTDSDRPYSLQKRIFLERYVPSRSGGGTYGDVRWFQGVRYVRRAGTAMAAVPGTSNHGKGTAVDWGRPWNTWGPLHDRFRAVLAPHGWRFPIPSEPWHGEYHRRLDKHHGEPVDYWTNIQKMLRDNGHKIAVDGLPGPGTNNELTIFQAARHLEPDAVPGASTMSALAGIYETSNVGTGTVWVETILPGVLDPIEGIDMATADEIIALLHDIRAALEVDGSHVARRVEQNNTALRRLEDTVGSREYDKKDPTIYDTITGE